MRPLLLFLITATATFPDSNGRHSAPLQSAECGSLVRLLSLPRAELLSNTTQLQTRAFEAGDDCITAIALRLTDSSSTTVGAAAYALHVIGGTRANDAIHAAVIGAAGDRARASLASGDKASAGEAVLAAQYFAAALEGPALGPGWIPRHNAALTLGMLRARESKAALIMTASPAGPSSRVAQAAAAALLWIDKAPCTINETSARDVITAISVAALICGVPTFHAATQSFLEQKFDGTPWRVWSLSEQGWSYRDALPGDNRIYPRLQFRTTFSDDSTRATTNLHTADGPGSLTVYKYLFRKSGTSWRVTGISFAGIS